MTGYDLTGLLVGSEGTLGVFTAITVRLCARPAATQTLLATFDDAVSAGESVGDLLRGGMAPSVLEFLDRYCVAVPCTAIPEVIRRFETLGRERGLRISCYGHAGDGNLHANVLWDDPGLDAAARAVLEDMLRIVLEQGGTITGEHGVGASKRRYLSWEQGAEVIALQRRLKAVFDPQGLLNPGKLLP